MVTAAMNLKDITPGLATRFIHDILHVSMSFQVRCTILDAWGWCIGMTQRDGTEREEGGGFRMGNTCIAVVDSC